MHFCVDEFVSPPNPSLSHPVATFQGLCLYLLLRSTPMRGFTRKLAAVTALLALLLPVFSLLAGTLAAGDLPACCGTAICPVHHRQMRDLQRDKSNCASNGTPGQRDCSMRACDAPQNPAVGTSAFVLLAPVRFALNVPAAEEAAPNSASRYSPSVAPIPLTPPPRTLPS